MVLRLGKEAGKGIVLAERRGDGKLSYGYIIQAQRRADSEAFIRVFPTPSLHIFPFPCNSLIRLKKWALHLAQR